MIGVVPERHQCIVVGAGILGLATARSLSRRGRDVLVLESSTSGHEHSGSKGTARIFRLSYSDPMYVQMAIASSALWRDLEGEWGHPLLLRTGQLNFGPDLPQVAAGMTQAGAVFERLTSGETDDRFPRLRVDGPSLFEQSSGVLVADDCLRALWPSGSLEIREHTGVRSLRDDKNGVAIVLAGGQKLEADVVVNCAGHGAIALMKGGRGAVSTHPSLQQVVYLQTAETELTIPIFIEWDDELIYGLPVPGQDVFKLSHHTPGPAFASEAATLIDDPRLLGALGQATRRLLPGLTPTPIATERCIYDNTPDTDFIIDRVGHIVVGCGTSGHGFKFGPLLGELLADLALGAKPRFDLSRFALHRPLSTRRPNQ